MGAWRSSATGAASVPSPPGPEGRVGLVPDEVANEFIRLQPEQLPVRHVAFQPAVLDGPLKCRIEGLQDFLATRLREEHAVSDGLEVLGRHLTGIHQAEYRGFDDEGSEDVGEVKDQRKTPFAGLVEVTDGRVEGRPVNLLQDGRVQEGIAEGQEGVHRRRRGTAGADEGVFGHLGDVGEGLVVAVAGPAFGGPEFVDGLPPMQVGPNVFEVLDGGLEGLAAVDVIS